MIRLTVNGKERELPAPQSVADFLASLNIHQRLIVVERNGEILKRDQFASVTLEEGDVVEIVHMVGGG